MHFVYFRYSVEVFPGPEGMTRVLIGSGDQMLVYEDRPNEAEALRTGAFLVSVLGHTTPARVLEHWGLSHLNNFPGGQLLESQRLQV